MDLRLCRWSLEDLRSLVVPLKIDAMLVVPLKIDAMLVVPLKIDAMLVVPLKIDAMLVVPLKIDAMLMIDTGKRNRAQVQDSREVLLLIVLRGLVLLPGEFRLILQLHLVERHVYGPLLVLLRFLKHRIYNVVVVSACTAYVCVYMYVCVSAYFSCHKLVFVVVFRVNMANMANLSLRPQRHGFRTLGVVIMFPSHLRMCYAGSGCSMLLVSCIGEVLVCHRNVFGAQIVPKNMSPLTCMHASNSATRMQDKLKCHEENVAPLCLSTKSCKDVRVSASCHVCLWDNTSMFESQQKSLQVCDMGDNHCPPNSACATFFYARLVQHHQVASW
jgi:hypothetical protein